jgi:tRNA threonylcarbamoyl adenosine modification protein (Sua5/YciO/YrdC/YwlC family)
VGEVLNGVDDAVAIIEAGGVVVLPTETVYGVVARPDERGVEKIFAVKERAAEKSLQLLVPDPSWLDELAHPAPQARVLADAFWPGPLTLVVTASGKVPVAVRKNGTVGLRQPSHPLALDVLRRTGPLAASSANRSGEPTPSTIERIRDVFGDRIDGYLDGGEIAGTASTVVSVTDGVVTILRSGALSEDVVKSALAGRFEAG